MYGPQRPPPIVAPAGLPHMRSRGRMYSLLHFNTILEGKQCIRNLVSPSVRQWWLGSDANWAMQARSRNCVHEDRWARSMHIITWGAPPSQSFRHEKATHRLVFSRLEIEY